MKSREDNHRIPKKKTNMESRQDYYKRQNTIKAPQFQNNILNNNNRI